MNGPEGLTLNGEESEPTVPVSGTLPVFLIVTCRVTMRPGRIRPHRTAAGLTDHLGLAAVAADADPQGASRISGIAAIAASRQPPRRPPVGFSL